MAKGKPLQKPQLNPALFYGEVISWTFRPTVTPEKGKYCYRYKLTFENGLTKSMQKGGFATKADAYKSKEFTLAQLHKHEFVAFEFTVKEFYDYWLYSYMLEEKKISYSTFCSYRNIIYNYFLKVWGNMKMLELDRPALIEALLTLKSESLTNLGFGIMSGSLKFAQSRNIIYVNASKTAIRFVRKKNKKKTACQGAPSPLPVLNVQQVANLLYQSKHHEPKIYIPLLLTLTAGLRISEALAIKFNDIDFGKKEIHIQRQIGRKTTDEGVLDNSLYAQTLSPKTSHGIRVIPVADFVLDEIVLAKGKYDQAKLSNPDFLDHDYVSFQDSGKPYMRSYMYKPYKRLLKRCNISFIRWHNLRHTYATLLSEENINLKAISVFMGHFSENFTDEVYITHQAVVFDAMKELTPFINDVLPNTSRILSIDIDEKYLLDVLPANAYNTGDVLK